MNPWIAKAAILAANVVLIADRAPHGHRSRSIKVVKSRKGTLEIVLLSVMWIAFCSKSRTTHQAASRK